MKDICSALGFSRQAFYKARGQQASKTIKAKAVLDWTLGVRKRQPQAGVRKLHLMMAKENQHFGRDRLFVLLKENNLLVKQHRSFTKTTNSRHWLRKYPNLIKDLTIQHPNQVFVSDITYLRTREGWCYLSLITDLFSRKIVGYHVNHDLSSDGPHAALRMALKGRTPSNLIHHSDQGMQFCSYGYIAQLKRYGVRVSMTEENHCYENAVAERVNGILKAEFGLGKILPSLEFARKSVRQSVQIYNQERLHTSLNYKTPDSIYHAAICS